MAEQYPVFNRQGPNIDVNLYVNALTQGIAAGNAQKTMTDQIVSGISGGISSGISTAQGVQAIRANNATLDYSEDPGVQQAKKDETVAQGNAAKRADETAALTQETDQNTAETVSKIRNDTAAIAAQDSSALRDMSTVGASGDVQTGMAAFQNPQYAQALNRNPVFAQQYVGTMRQLGGDPAVLDPLQKQYDSLAYSASSGRAHSQLQSLAAKNAEKNSELAGEAQSYFSTTPEFDGYLKKDNFDYRMMDLRQHPKKNTNDPTVYDYVYGDNVIKAGAVSKDEYKEQHARLQAWKGTFGATAGNPPESLSRPTVQQAPQGSGLAVKGLGSRQPLVERDITPKLTEKDITPVKKVDPFLEGAVKVGGFSPSVVEKAAPTFKKLSTSLDTLSFEDFPQNSPIFKQVINESAEQVSNTIYDTNPAIQSGFTQAQVDAHNRQVDAQFASAPKSIADIAKGDIGSGAILREPKADGTIAGLAEGLNIDFEAPTVESILKVKTPKELYFLTSGSGIVKQMTDFSLKALDAKKRYRQLQLNKAKSNSSQVSILQGIASGN